MVLRCQIMLTIEKARVGIFSIIVVARKVFYHLRN